jgi:proteasome accessory factor B
MLRVHQRIQQRGYPNCVQLAGELEVSLVTLKRDVAFMRDRLQLPIAYDSRRHGYHYTRRVDQFPGLPLATAEIHALAVAHQALVPYRGTPFAERLAQAYRRTVRPLDRDTREGLGQLQAVLSFRPLAPPQTQANRFDRLTQALEQRRPLRFRYRNLGAPGLRPRLVHPYHLACIDGHWYLFGYDVARQAIRTFAVARIDQPRLARGTFTRAVDFEPGDYLRGSFAVLKGDGDYEVVIEFDRWATDLVRDRLWHASQTLIELAGAGSQLRLRLSSLEEVARWVLSWGDHATVVRPRALVELVGRAARSLARRHDLGPGAVSET